MTSPTNSPDEQERLRFLNSLDACIVATDAEGRITAVNACAERMLGYAAEELVGIATPLLFLDAAEGLAPDAEAAFEALVQRTAGADERAWTFLRKDGGSFPAKLRVNALHDHAGKANGFLIVARDISREREVEHSKEAAERATEAKSRFLANLSHEIRTPLNGILGVNAMLLESTLSPEQSRLASIVQESAESLLNIVEDTLDFSKEKSGLIELEETTFSLSRLIGVVERLHGVRARARGLVLETRIGDDIPEQLIGDSSRVRQVINHFVSNATKFSERGKITISATAESFDRQGRVWVRICVQDSGIGVPHDAQQRIFDGPEGPATRRYGGSGLGLSICRQLVQLMGGEIGVESEVGEGSTFWFTVRLRSAESDGKTESAGTSILVPGLRVLLAEDSTVNQMVILHELRRMGCFPKAVNNGWDALKAVRDGEYDLVLMDCQMPEMDGYEAAREIRRLPSELPIVGITASARGGELERCLAAGMSGYLRKPFSRAQLRDVVVAALPAGFMLGTEGAEPALGEDEVDALLSGADTDGGLLLRRLAEAFAAEAAEALESLNAAVARKNRRQACGAVHKLKGSGSNFGARPLSRLCDTIERHAQSGSFPEAAAAIPDLRREVQRVIDSLHAILPRNAGVSCLQTYP